MINLRNELEKVADFIVGELQLELVRQRHNASGKLLAGIKSNIISTENGYVINITSDEPYYKLVDGGRKKGKRPPISAIIEWVRLKGLEQGDREIVNAAWAISQSIAAKGTLDEFEGVPKINFIQNAIDGSDERVADMILDLSFSEVELFFDNKIRDIQKNYGKVG